MRCLENARNFFLLGKVTTSLSNHCLKRILSKIGDLMEVNGIRPWICCWHQSGKLKPGRPSDGKLKAYWLGVDQLISKPPSSSIKERNFATLCCP